MLCHSRGAGNLQQPQVRPLRRIGYIFLIGTHGPPAFYGHLHVGLPGCQPDFPYKHVIQHGGLSVADSYAMLLETALRGVDLHAPFAIGISGRAVCALIPGRCHADACTRGGLAPDRGLAFLLEHHVVGKEGSQFDLCTQRERGKCRHCKKEESFHFGFVLV